MESVDFILRIILRLRDEASKKLAAIRTEVKGIGKDADSSKAKIDGISSSISAMAERLGNLNKEIGAVKKSIGDLGNKDDIAKINRLGQAIDKVTDSTARFRENGTQEIRVQIAGTDQLIEREEKLLTVKERAAQLRKEEGLSAKEAKSRAELEKLAREVAARHTSTATVPEADDTSALSKQADVIIRKGKRKSGPNKGQKIFQLFDQANDVVLKTRISLARAEQDLEDLVNNVGEWATTVTGVADAERETGKTVRRSSGRRKKANDDVIAATEENRRAVKANTAAIHKTTLAFQDTPDFQEFPDRSASNARERRARATREAIAADQAARLARESDRDTNVPIRPEATDRESRQFNALVDLVKQGKEFPKGHGLDAEHLSQIREQAKAEVEAENALRKRDTPAANRFQQQSSDIGARADKLAALFQQMVKATEAISERFSVEQKGKGFQVIDTETGKRQQGTGLFKTEERAASRREDLIATLTSVNDETTKYINAFKKASENVRQASNDLIAGISTPSGNTLDGSAADESKPVRQRRAINGVTEAMRVQATRLVELRKAAAESTEELNKLFEVQKKGKKFEIIDTESGKRAAGTGLFGSKRAANERRGELVLDKSTFSPETLRLSAALRESTRKVRRLADAIAKGVEDAQEEVAKVFESAEATATRQAPTPHAAGERKASEEATTVKRKSITLMRKELAQEEELAPAIAKVNKDSLEDRKKLNKTQARAIAKIEEVIGPLVNLSVSFNELREKIARVEFQDPNDPRRRFAQTLGGRGKAQDRLTPITTSRETVSKTSFRPIGGGSQESDDIDMRKATDEFIDRLTRSIGVDPDSLRAQAKNLRDEIERGFKFVADKAGGRLPDPHPDDVGRGFDMLALAEQAGKLERQADVLEHGIDNLADRLNSNTDQLKAVNALRKIAGRKADPEASLDHGRLVADAEQKLRELDDEEERLHAEGERLEALRDKGSVNVSRELGIIGKRLNAIEDEGEQVGLFLDSSRERDQGIGTSPELDRVAAQLERDIRSDTIAIREHSLALRDAKDDIKVNEAQTKAIGDNAEVTIKRRIPHPSEPDFKPIGGASDDKTPFGKDADKIARLIVRMQTELQGLNDLHRRFRKKEVDDELFIERAAAINRRIKKIADAAPTTGFGAHLGEEFSKNFIKVRAELQKFKDLGKGDGLSDIDLAFKKIKDSIVELTQEIKISQGGMKILREEGERMRALGVKGLTAELTRSERELFSAQRELDENESKGGATKTLERRIKAIDSRIQAQKEAIRQLLTQPLPGDADTNKRLVEDQSSDTDLDEIKKVKASFQDLLDVFARVHDELDSGKVDRRQAFKEFNEIAASMTALSKTKGEIGSPLRREISTTATIVADVPRKGDEDDKEIAREEERQRLARKKLHDETVKQIEANREARRKAAELTKKQQEKADRDEAEARRKFYVDQAARFLDYTSQLTAANTQLNTSFAESRRKDERDAEAHHAKLLELNQRLAQAIEDESSGAVSNRRSAEVFRAIAEDYTRLRKVTKDNIHETTRLGEVSTQTGERATAALKRARNEVGNNGTAFQRLTNKIGGFGHAITSSGENVAKLDNQLRGLLVLAIFAFAQQLLTALTGLAGGLVAIGSSAVFAGGALGGAFVAGIAQAIPAVLLLGAALAQVKEVTDAINQADLVQQQGFHKSANAAAKKAKDDTAAANKADAVANAEDAVSGARDRVGDATKKLGDAQKDLTKAREEAKKSLLDLIAAEHNAELAARGAALSEAEAQDTLSAALAGGSQSDLARARLGVLEARQGTRDANRGVIDAKDALTKGRKIEGTDTVVAAKDAVKDAKKALDDANKAVDKAGQGLEKASRNAIEVEDVTDAASDKLVFLLSLLSPAQLRLFVALQKIRADYKRVFNDVTDIIIDSFVRVVDTADKILTSAPFLITARNLANAIAGAIDAVRTKLLENPEKLGKIFDIINAGAKNISGPVTDFLVAFGDAFINIADSAGPALSLLLGWIAGIVGDFDKLTQDSGKLDRFFDVAGGHAAAWLDLIKNVVIFFAVLAGAGQTEGLSLVESFNQSVVDATQWLRDHRAEVTKFFEDAGRVTRRIGEFIVDLATAIIAVFDPEKLDVFITFLSDTMIPALEQVTKTVGFFVGGILTLIDSVPGLSWVTEKLIVITLFASIITATAGAMAFLALHLATLFGYFSKFSSLVGKASSPLGGLIGKLALLAGGAKALGPLAKVLERIAAALGTKAGAGTAAKIVGSGAVAAAAAAVATTVGGGAAKAAGEAGTKAAGRFTGKFAGILKGVFSKGNLFIALGLGAVSGIIDGIKHGSVEAGIRGFAHSISFGIVDSAGEVAEKALDRTLEKLRNKKLPKDFFTGPDPITADREDRPGGVNVRPRGRGSVFGSDVTKITEDPKKTRAREDLEDMDPKARKLLLTFIKLQEQFEIFRQTKDTAGMVKIKGQLDDVAKKAKENGFSGLADDVISFKDKAVTALDEVRAKLVELNKPFDIATTLGNALQKDPKQWKLYVDNSIKEVAKLPPELQGQGKKAVLRLVAGLEEQGALPPKTADKIRARVNKPFKEMADKTGDHSRRMVRELTANLQIAVNTAVAGGSGMVVALNDILKSLGVGPVKHIKVPSPKQLGSLIGGLVGATQASGGIVGMASGGLLGKMGERGKDLIPTWLGRGEMVLNNMQQRYLQPAVSAYYGHPLEETFKRLSGEHAGPAGFPGFRAGTDGGPSNTRAAQNLFGPHPHNINANLLKLLTLLRTRFPNSSVGSTTDHSTKTSSGNVSDHVAGNAFDISGTPAVMNRMVRFILSSGIWHQLKQGIHQGRPNLSINNGEKVSTGYWGTGTWNDHINHLHLAMTESLGQVRASAEKKLRRFSKTEFNWPVEGSVKDLGQAVFDKINTAVNKKLGRAARAANDDTKYPATSKKHAGARGERVFRFFKEKGFNDNQAAAWVGNFVQESGLDSAVVQPNGEGHGLAQWGGGRFAALQEFAARRKKRWQDFQTQLDFVWFELKGSESGAYRAIKGAKSLEGAVNAIGGAYERFGIRGDRSGPARRALDDYGPEFAEGGIVPGGKGKPIGIIAHAGEWVVNEMQQSDLANRLGLNPRSLASMLGFHGAGGAKGYAGGTTVKDDEKAINIKGTSAFERERIKQILKGIYRLPTFAVTEWADLVKEGERALKAIGVRGRNYTKRLKELNKIIDNIKEDGVKGPVEKSKLAEAKLEKKNIGKVTLGGKGSLLSNVDQLTKEGGLFDQMDTARADVITRMQNGLSKITFRLKRFGKKFVVKQIGDGVEIADQELLIAQKTLRQITGEKGIVAATLKKINARLRKLRKGGIDKDEVNEFESLKVQKTNLKGRALKLATDQQAAIEALFNAQVAQQQAVIDDVNDKASKTSASADLFDRVLAVFGNKGSLNLVVDARIGAIKTQIGGLQDAFNKAKASGNTELANSLTAQIQELQVSIIELSKQKLQNAIDAVNATAEKGEFTNNILDRIQAVTGNKALGISKNQIVQRRKNEATQQIGSLSGLRDQAAAAGNADLVEQLNRQIIELQVSIAEMSKQQIQNNIDAVNEAARKRDFKLGIRERLANLFGNTGAIAKLADDRVASMRTQIGGLRQQLIAAKAAGNTDLVASLTESITDLETTITETINGKIRAAMEEINKVAARRSTKLDLLSRLADAAGQVGLGGRATLGGESLTRGGILAARGDSIKQQQDALKQLLLQTQSNSQTSGNTALIQDLNDQILELTVQMAENTKAIFNAKVEDVNNTASTALNFLGLQQRLAELTGTLTQTDTAEQVKILLENRAKVLEEQNTGLTALLAEAQAKGDQQAINDLTAQLLENKIATVENSIALRDLTHKDDLQQFSSSAWLQFREAIFDGLGNLLPQFSQAVPSAAMGAHIAQGGMINVHTGEQIVPAKVVAGSNGAMVHGGGDVNLGGVHITNPTEVADPVYLGNAIGWRIVNNPNLRP